MLGTYTHVGGPPPLRPGVEYAYPFEAYAPHVDATELCLRLPWHPRHQHDDTGAVDHPEQDVFVSRVLSEASVAHRASAPGEYIFPNFAAAETALVALAIALDANDWL